LKSLNSVEKVSSKIVIATFTNISDEADVINVYDDLSTLVQSIPKHNVIIMGGEMNAYIDRDMTAPDILIPRDNKP